MKKHLQAAALILSATVLLASCGGTPQAEPQSPANPVPVAALKVRTETVPEYYEAVGTVQSKTVSVLGAQLSATVEKFTVNPGDRVSKGEVLATLDDRAVLAQLHAAQAGVEAARQGSAGFEQALTGAQAELHLAQITLRRYQGLWVKNSVSRQELDEATMRDKAAAARVASLEAQIKQTTAAAQQAEAKEAGARTLYSYTRILSPIDGVVTAKGVDAGSLVMPGTPLLTVEDSAHYRLVASVPEHYQLLMKVGEAIPLVIGSMKMQGSVAEVVPAADPSSRTFTVKIAFPSSSSCRSGDYGAADIPIGTSSGIFVPKSSLVEEGELEGVFAISRRSVAQFRLVKTGEERGGQVAVLAGLSAGETIATTNVDRLSEGAHVEER